MTDLELVEAAVAGRDDRLALHYLAQVLATSPNDEKGLALLSGISTRLDVLKFVPGKAFVGNTVLRAWALQRAGAPEAVRLLARAATAYSDRGYDVVLASWLVARHTARQPLPTPERQTCYRFLASALDPTIGLHRFWPGEQALLEGAVMCASALAAFLPDEVGVLLTSAALRRSGRLEEALELTREGAARDEVLVLRAQGLALRAAGQGAEAARVFERVEVFEPEASELVEQARSWYVAREPGRALEALRRVPRPWTDEVAAIERLCLEPVPVDPIAALDLQHRRQKGHGLLAPRKDATANALRQMAESGAGAAMRVSGWESPSNRLAFALASGKGTDVGALDYEADFGEVAFDPLATGGGLALWVREHGGVRQAVPAPALEVQEAVQRVAARPGDGLSLLEAAEVEARRFGADHALAFAQAMVHPLEGQSGQPDALYRWQCAAAALIAHLPGAIDGPKGTTLRALAHGQVDWTASAAVFALAHLARYDAEAAHFARQALVDAVPMLVVHAAEPRGEQLRVALGSIPTVPPSALSALDAWARALTSH